VIAFILAYRNHKQLRRYTIGRYREFSATSARERAKELRDGLRAGKDPIEQKHQADAEPTFAELAEQYLTHAKTYKRAGSLRNDHGKIQMLLPQFGARQVKAITQRDIEKLHRDLKATPYHANRYLALLSTMFNLAVKRGWRIDNPVKGIPKFAEDRRERWLTVEELGKLNQALDQHHDQNAADVIRMLLLTGSRRGEVLQADWAQFDLKRGVWTKPSHHTKQKKIEHIPLSDAALALLRRMKPKPSGPLFPGAGERGSRVGLRRPWMQVCKAAGLATAVKLKGKKRMITRYKPTLRLHDLRHTYASHLVSAGVSLQLVGKLIGHTNPATTNRYAHVADEALRIATNQFGGILTAAGKKQK
jgi:integrase